MAARHFGPALRRWLNSLGSKPIVDLSDDQLLQRFVQQRDETAFETLLCRHGPLVFGVCRHLLRNSHDADDAFQATFLVLACRAASIRYRNSVAGFLYGTACRIARRLRSQKTQQHELQRRAVRERTQASRTDEVDSETLALLHEELNRLPRKYRDVLILCYLQGKSNEEAARQLGYPLGSMWRHLSRARELLRERLLNRGVDGVDGLAILAGAAIAEHIGVAVPSALLFGTWDTIRRHALASALLAGSSPPAAVMLAQGILRTVWVTRLTAASLLLTVGLVFAGGVAVMQTPADKPSPTEAKAPPIETKRQEPPRLDRYGDPLPDGVLVRMGTARLRHPLAIRLRFAADGKTLLSVGQDQTVRFWDLATGKLQRLQQLPRSQKVMALSADGKTVALTSEEHLHLWDIAAAKERGRIATGKLDRERLLSWVEISPDGKTLAAGNNDNTVILWDIASGKERSRCKHKDGHVHNLAFSADSKTLAAIGDGKSIILWDVASGKELSTINCQTPHSFYAQLTFSPDDKMLVESSIGSIFLWDVESGKRIDLLEFSDAKSAANCNFAFAPDGKTMAVGLGNYVAILDYATRKEVKRLKLNRSGTWRQARSLGFSPDGKLLASLTSGQITLWEVATGKQLHELPSHFDFADSVALSPNGKYVASACGGDGSVRLWEAQRGKPLQVWRLPHHLIHFVLFTPDSTGVIAAGHFGECRMWDTVSGKERHSFRPPGVLRDHSLQDFAEMITGIHLSPDGKHLSALSFRSETKEKVPLRNRYLTTWDVDSGKQIQRRPLSSKEGISPLLEQLSPDGKYAPIFTRGRLMIFDVVADRPLRYITGTWADSKAFSADGKLLAYSEGGSGVQRPRVRLHDLATGADVWTVDAGSVFHREFSPDSRYLLTVGDAGMRLWELASGREVFRYPNLSYLHFIYDGCLSFTSDGRSVVVGMPDTNILIWDLAPATRQKRKLTAADLDRLWTDLADKNAARAYRAAGTLIADPEGALPFLSQRLQPVKEDAPRIRRLIADLDSEQFQVRDAAWKELEKMDDTAHVVLRQELTKAKSLEQRRRIQALLSVPWIVQAPDKLRQIRAIMVLEQIGDAAARRVLERLAGGSAEARQTCEAKTALQRLQKRL